MNATANTLTYRELQAKLKDFKAQGLTDIKLNSKQNILQLEYDRIIVNLEQEAQAVLDAATSGKSASGKDNYPFSSNTAQVENNVEYRINHLLAMNPSTAPSWLSKQYKVYVVDGVDYLPFELEQQLQGQICELACEWKMPTVDVQIVTQPCTETAPTTAQETKTTRHRKVEQRWQEYIRHQDTTIQQAAVNGVEILKCTGAFLQGFIEGLSASTRKKIRQ
jgi:hypothetical protein